MARRVRTLPKRDSNKLGWTSRIRRADSTGERGATLVEAAFVFGLLFLTLFAVVEFGMAFKDYLSVSHASRGGARVGATFGQDPSADILILRAVESTLAPIGLAVNDKVTIGEPGGAETQYTYKPGLLSDCTNLPDCCDWIPCPELGRDTHQDPVWLPTDRDISAPTTDRIFVEIQFTHNWLTGFFGNTTDFTTATDFRIEPQIFGP